ncbi:hypothetical protein NUW58_g1711 [Xylaria curta]|uniref:Uncharacterized protein n=1 Tax=Xylaria curta TaxID=42375 RepID=A0ACC1PIX7_9PEZI|nr:hypothetical protein NUW58_g1711 [Xylaria curta]
MAQETPAAAAGVGRSAGIRSGGLAMRPYGIERSRVGQRLKAVVAANHLRLSCRIWTRPTSLFAARHVRHAPALSPIYLHSWSFPGGAVDEGELSKETVVREFKEEVNLDVRVVSIEGETLWGETEDRLDDTWHCSFFVVEQIDSSQVPQVMEPMKHVAVGWMRWDELWEGILAHINGNKEWRGTVEVIVDNRGTTEKRIERMSFFETMNNMVKEYPDRSDLACLEKHL